MRRGSLLEGTMVTWIVWGVIVLILAFIVWKNFFGK